MFRTVQEKNEREVIYQYITFSLGDEDYGIPVLQVLEIVKLEKLITVPHSKEYFDGLMDIRGLVVPIIDLKKKLGIFLGNDGEIHTDKNNSKRAIIIKTASKKIGLAVDKVSHVHSFSESNIDSGPSTLRNTSNYFITGVGKIQENFIILLDLENLFSEDELNIISSYRI